MHYLFTLLLFSCFSSISLNAQGKITVKNELTFNSKPLELNQSYVTVNKDTILIETVKFYLSNFKIEFQNGTTYKEKNSYHLIDYEEPETLQFELEKINSKIKSVSFDIGVDSLANVSGAMSNDLDATKGMYWSWQSGFINLKIEGKSASCKTRKNKFQFHIGGYQKNTATLRNIVLFFDATHKDDSILNLNYDLSKLFESINLKELSTVMIPGNEAVKIANNFCKIISKK